MKKYVIAIKSLFDFDFTNQINIIDYEVNGSTNTFMEELCMKS